MSKTVKIILIVLVIAITGFVAYILIKNYQGQTESEVKTAPEAETSGESVMSEEEFQEFIKNTVGGNVVSIDGDKIVLSILEESGEIVEREYLLTANTTYKTTNDEGLFVEAKKEDMKIKNVLFCRFKEGTNELTEIEIVKLPEFVEPEE